MNSFILILPLEGASYFYSKRLKKEILLTKDKVILIEKKYFCPEVVRKFLCIPVKNKFLKKYSKKIGNEEFIKLDDRQQLLVEEIRYFDLKKKSIYSKISNLRKKELLLLIFYTLENSLKTSIDSTHHRMLSVKKFILNNYNKKFTTKYLAKLFNTNTHSLKQQFKLQFNHTIFEFVLHCKMDEAKKLLENRHLTINDISLKVGYKNANHFSTAFKKRFYKTPKEYRKEMVFN